MKTLDFRLLALGFVLIAAIGFGREVTGEKWKVGTGPADRMNLEFFQGESIEYTQPLKDGRSVYTLDTNSVYTWEIDGWPTDSKPYNYTNTHALTTGIVASVENGELYFELTGEQANITNGTYLGFIKALHADGKRDVLAWQRIKFEWSEWSLLYDLVEPIARPYFSKEEVLAISNALSSELSGVSDRVGTNEAAIADLQHSTNVIYTSLSDAIADVANIMADLSSVTETQVLHTAQIAANSSQLAAVSGRVDIAEADIVATDAELAAHTGDTGNPHSVTAAQVGLGNVDNTSDVDKPISTAQQVALDQKQDASTAATDLELSAHTGDTGNPHSVTAAQVGLGNVDNTSDADKPISTAQAATNVALQADINTRQPAATAATDAELSAGLDLKVAVDASNISTNYAVPTNSISINGWSDPEYNNTNYVYGIWEGSPYWEYDGTEWAGIYWISENEWWEFWIGSSAVDTNSDSNLNVLPKTGWSTITVSYDGDDKLWVEKIGGASGADVAALKTNALMQSYDDGTHGFEVGEIASKGKVKATDSAASISATSTTGSSAISAGLGAITIGSYMELGGPGPIGVFGNVGIEGGLEMVDGGIDLDRLITSWDDIGVTYSNAVRQNSPITVTNDSSWTGWTTTGDLVGDAIFLDTDEYMISPVQTNGIGDIDIDEDGSGRISWSYEIVTNGVQAQTAAPYYGTNGQLKITAGSPMPMMSAGMTVSSVVLTGYENPSDAGTVQYVANLCRVDTETRDCDLTRKIYVDEAKADAISSAAASLSAYAANADKTIRGSELRLGNMWVVSPTDATGERWICSGGEISGDGELVGTTNDFIIAKNDYPLISFTSDASGLFVTNYNFDVTSSNVTVSLYIATNGVHSTPFAEWSENLKVGEWNRVLAYDTETYPTSSNGTYELTFTLPVADTMYFRAMQQEGESVMTVHVDRMDLGGCNLWMLDLETSNMVQLAVSNGAVVVIQE